MSPVIRAFVARSVLSGTASSSGGIRSLRPAGGLSLFSSLSESSSAPSDGLLVLERLQSVLEEYRSTHYSQEIPPRFKKEIVRAAQRYSTDVTADSKVAAQGLNQVLHNIDLQEKISTEDVDVLFAELAEDGINGTISVDRLLKML